MNDIYLSWLAGLIDGDGCFTCSLNKRPNGQININPQVRVAGAEKDTKFYESIKETLNIGKIYFSNKGKEHGICSWQVVGTNNVIDFCKIILPYLHIKKENCEKLIKSIEYVKSTYPGHRKKRSYNQMFQIVKNSIGINKRRQTNRWRHSQNRNIDFWEKYLKKFYL